MTVRTAVFPAAGLGTRFLPATKAQPKEMLPLVDKPMIQYVVEEAVAAGLDRLTIVTGRGKRAIGCKTHATLLRATCGIGGRANFCSLRMPFQIGQWRSHAIGASPRCRILLATHVVG